MHLPPRKHLAWPLRAGLSAGLASLMSLARSTIFVDAASANVLSAAVFGTVVAIVCSGPTRGSTLATSWGILGGAIMGCILSALCAALFGSSLGAVLFSNSLVGVLVLYPRRFPVLAQKFAFGGSTIMLWGVYEGLDLRWSTLGIPICTAYGAVCAIFVSLLSPCGASDVAREAAASAVESLVDALDDAVAAYASLDPSEREMRRARAEKSREDAERHLAALRAAAADARWERQAIAFGARVVPGGRARRAANKTTKPEAAAEALASAALHVRGMSLALDALAETDVARWHLLDPPSPGAHPARVFEGGSDSVDAVLVAVGDAMRAATRARKVEEEDVVGAAAGAKLAEASARLDAILTEERRRHYAPNAKYSDATETVARRALQANHLFVFSFQSLAEGMVKHLASEGAPGEGSESLCETCEMPALERRSGGANGESDAPKKSETSGSAAAQPTVGGSDTVGALLQCKFHADPRQMTYALKLSSACAVAGVLGWAVSGNGSWAALTITMVGTREGEAVGGSFNAALLRMQGTVIGAMFSFALVVLLRGDLASGAGAGRLILLAGFSFLTTYLRLNAEYAYAGIVAAFTAYIVALGIPDDADVQTARTYAHRRIEQNLLGLVVLIVVEVVLFPTFAHDAARVAAAKTMEAARVAAETVYDATVGTDCARCRERAAEDAQGALDAVESKLGAQKTLLVQAAAEPHLWSPTFPLAAHQTLATDLENVRRILGLMREALHAMAASESERERRKKRGGAFGGAGDADPDPRAQVAALLTPTDGYVTNLRRAVRARLGAAAEDLGSGEARWETRAASASIAKAQAALERAFVLHTLEIRERYRAGDASMFLPNHLMVPWHAYMLCTHVLANTVESLGAASWNALLAVKPPAKDEEEEDEEEKKEEEDPNGGIREDDLCGVCVEGDGSEGGNGGGSAAATKTTDEADAKVSATAQSTGPKPPPTSSGAGESSAMTPTREPLLGGGGAAGEKGKRRRGKGKGGALDFDGASDPGSRSDA